MTALLVDLGNVVAFFDHQRACRALASLSSPPRTPDELHAAIYGSGLETEVDTGRLSGADFLERLRAWCPGASDGALTRAWSDIFEPNPDVVSRLPALRRAGLKIVLASNTNDLHYAWLERHLAEPLSFVDVAVLSLRVGATKPSPVFFDACLQAAGADAGDCFFIDDKPEYVAAAEALGIPGLVYSGPAFDRWAGARVESR
jgi:FMN phosphatase YigB (HAD superfamily)